MDVYKIDTFTDRVKGNSYVGRGIVTGMTPSGKAATAYFIMGRSANSRNRVFTIRDEEVFTEPFDASKVEDPSLIIYAAIREYGDSLIVTNGDQTDTIYEGLDNGLSFSKALESRQFEPDAPNLTPRISSITDLASGRPSRVNRREWRYRTTSMHSPMRSGMHSMKTTEFPSTSDLRIWARVHTKRDS